MPFSRLHNALQSFMPLISTHSFNQGLLKGNLPFSVFNQFLMQDKYYLSHYAKALTNIAHRLHHQHQHDAKAFHTFANSIKKTEINMHHRYLNTHQSTRFFKPIATNINPAINAYIQHLHESTQTKPIPVAIAAMLPCFVIYRELGAIMPNNPEHRFYDWIKTYSSSGFLDNTEKMIAVFNAHDQVDLRDQALESFTASVQHEIKFWDSVIEVGELRGEKHAANTLRHH
ncbi:MAG TPA: hypothetical protein VFU82_06395 [Gammaproteobacteria bacterium]|nr:hypothetical protein [Gammaproteobacteria bacterium]